MHFYKKRERSGWPRQICLDSHGSTVELLWLNCSCAIAVLKVIDLHFHS